MIIKKGLKLTVAGVVAGMLFGVQSAAAGGYGLLEQSAEGVGVAYAGSVTGYGDGSAVFFNPAAISQIDGTVMSAGLNVIITSAEFNDEGSMVSGFPNSGENGPDGGVTGFVPNVYAVHNFGKLALGFGVNAPFGLETDYNDTWVGRYQAIKSELQVVNFQSALSYQVADHIFLGINAGAYYVDAELSNAVDFGTVGFAALGPSTASALGLFPQQNDGKVTVKGTDWATSWGLGALVTYGPEDRNRVGIGFRGKSTLHLHGDGGDFEVPSEAQILTSSGAFTDTGVRASATLPESITAGVQHWLTEEVAFFYESAWTRWSHFKELRVKFENNIQPDNVTVHNWENTWRHSFGLKFHPVKRWEFRTGFTYDQTPIKSREFRTPRIPDADRRWLAGGIGYQINDDLSVDFNYAHIFVPDEHSEVTGPTGDTLVGSYDSHVDIASLSLTWTL